MKTLTIPHDTSPPKFEIKVGDSFHLKFDKDGEANHHDLDHFDPSLPKHKVGPSTPVSTHRRKKRRGEYHLYDDNQKYRLLLHTHNTHWGLIAAET
jgi:hypothetical protein